MIGNHGGGIFTTNSATIVSSTITDNAAEGADSGGGVFVNGGTATIRNSIIAANRNNFDMPDVIGAFVSNGYNFIGNLGTATGFDQTGDQAVTDDILYPRLAALGNNGGTTPTHAL